MMLRKEQIAAFGNFSITAGRWGGEEEKKEKPTQKQLVLQAPPAQRPACRCGEAGLGWSEECGGVLRGLRRAQRSRSGPRAPRTTHRVPTRAQGARLARPCLPRSPDSTAPGRPPAAQGWRSVSVRPWVCSPGPPERQEPAVLTCAPSAQQRAESGGARARHPRGGPCSGGGPLLGLRCQGGGRSALLLIHEAALTAKGLDGRCARPGFAAPDTRCGRPTPLGAHLPASAFALGTERRGRVQLGAERPRPPSRDPPPGCPSLKPGLLRQLPLGVCEEETRLRFRSKSSNFSGPW